MKLSQLVLKGMRGRWRDTRLILAVLALAFLFLAFSTVLLSSIQNSQEKQRVESHGLWQVMRQGAGTAEREALTRSVKESAASTIIGLAQSTGPVGTADESLMLLGSLKLLEGSLPATRDEVLLTRGLMDARKLKVGDTFRLVFELPHITTSKKKEYDIRQALARFWHEAYDRFGQIELQASFEAWWDSQPEDLYSFQSGPRPPARDLRRDAYDSYYHEWLQGNSGLFRLNTLGGNRRAPHHQGDITVSVNSMEYRFRLEGAGWMDREGSVLDLGHVYSSLKLHKDYRVSGVIASYAENWDKGGLELPEAFLSPLGEEQIRSAIHYVEALNPTMHRYEPKSLLLLYQPGASARELLTGMLPLMPREHQPAYRVDAHSQSWSNYGGPGGIFTGLDSTTLTERPVEFREWDGYITFMYQDQYHRVPSHLLYEGGMELPGLLPLLVPEVSVEEALLGRLGGLRTNAYTYPWDPGSLGGNLQTLLSAALAVLTLAAVLQLFLSQLRRRARCIAVLKALGATPGQILRMFFLESSLLALVSLPLGTALGLLLCLVLASGLGGAINGGALRLFIHWPSLTFSLGMGLLALYVGSGIPMLFSLRIPLLGSFEAAPSRKRLTRPGDSKRITPRRLVWRNARFNPGRTLAQTLLMGAIILSALTVLFISHQAWAYFHAQVRDRDRPDYVLQQGYGMNTRWLNENLEKLWAEVPGVRRADALVMAEQVTLHLSEEQRLQSSLLQVYQRLPSSTLNLKGLQVTAWGIDPEGPLMARLKSMLDLGGIDSARFAAGEEAVLVLPRFLVHEGQTQTSLRPSERSSFQTGAFILPGEELLAATTSKRLAGDRLEVFQKEVPLLIAGLIYDFKQEAIWPIPDLGSGPLLIGSRRLIPRLYPNAEQRMNTEQARITRLLNRLYDPVGRGQTFLHVYLDADSDAQAAHSAMLRFLPFAGYEMTDLQNANRALQSNAAYSSMLSMVLGSFVFLVAILILGNSLASAALQERRRAGILQALGLPRRRMWRSQALHGLELGLLSLLLAHIPLLGLALLFALRQLPPGGEDVLLQLYYNTLRGYPYWLHLGLCALFLALSALMHGWALRKTLRNSAAENIADAR